jgi:hypothetical protein
LVVIPDCYARSPSPWPSPSGRGRTLPRLLTESCGHNSAAPRIFRYSAEAVPSPRGRGSG